MATGVSVTIRGHSDGLKDQDVRELYYGKYLFLNVVTGMENITQLHDLLYSNEFSAFDLGLPYIPHMTVGKLDDAKQLNDAFNSVKDNEAVFKSRITKISVEMIGENEESIIIIEKQLC